MHFCASVLESNIFWLSGSSQSSASVHERPTDLRGTSSPCFVETIYVSRGPLSLKPNRSIGAGFYALLKSILEPK